jgi:hypothetical protein
MKRDWFRWHRQKSNHRTQKSTIMARTRKAKASVKKTVGATGATRGAASRKAAAARATNGKENEAQTPGAYAWIVANESTPTAPINNDATPNNVLSNLAPTPNNESWCDSFPTPLALSAAAAVATHHATTTTTVSATSKSVKTMPRTTTSYARGSKRTRATTTRANNKKMRGAGATASNDNAGSDSASEDAAASEASDSAQSTPKAAPNGSKTSKRGQAARHNSNAAAATADNAADAERAAFVAQMNAHFAAVDEFALNEQTLTGSERRRRDEAERAAAVERALLSAARADAARRARRNNDDDDDDDDDDEEDDDDDNNNDNNTVKRVTTVSLTPDANTRSAAFALRRGWFLLNCFLFSFQFVIASFSSLFYIYIHFICMIYVRLSFC